jgi:hypothetical protein
MPHTCEPSLSPLNPQLYRFADAIALSFHESSQSRKRGDFLAGVRLAAAVTEIVVTYRRTLVVDCSGKPQKWDYLHSVSTARVKLTFYDNSRLI